MDLVRHPRMSEDMCPSRPNLALLLSLMLLAGLSGCGPASSDNPANPASQTSVGASPLSKQSPLPNSNSLAQVAQTANAQPLASRNESGISGKGVGDSPPTTPASSSKATGILEPLVVPDWMTKDLESPDVGTRLRALDKWVQTAPPGADDPLILALENKDQRVRARAMELIEQNWARAADAAQ